MLRALDTVEDDMSIPLEKKVPMLRDFHTYLYEDEWRFTGSQQKDRQVLEDFPTVSGTTRANDPYDGGRVLISMYKNLDIAGIQEPRAGVQRRHLGYLPPYGTGNG